MAGPGRVDPERARFNLPLMIPLAAGQYQNVFIAFMHVLRNVRRLAKPQQRSRRPGDAVPIETMDLHTILKGLPGHRFRMLGNVKQVR